MGYAKGMSDTTSSPSAPLDPILAHLQAGAELRARAAAALAPQVAEAAGRIAACFRAGGKLLLAGNGGSAADCQHMAAEFTSRLRRELNRQALPAIALTTDTSFLTAFTNDVNFEDLFARLVEAYGRPGDLFLGISTSGSSKNIVRAVAQARTQGMGVLILCGEGGSLAAQADLAIAVPSRDTPLIQELHLACEHAICDGVERLLFPEAFAS